MTALRLPPLLLCALLLGGCGDSSDDLDQWMNQAGSNLVGQVDPIPAVQPPPKLVYQVTSLPSPFDRVRLQLARQKAGANAPDPSRPREPLENFELERLAMVGSLALRGERFALVEAPNGLYRVRRGSFLGTDYGMVTAINEDEIKIVETVEDASGEWIRRESSLHLLATQDQSTQGQKK